MRGSGPVTGLWPRLRTPLALVVIIGSAVALAWMGASIALDRAEAGLLSVDLGSRLSADYSAEAGAPPRFAQLDEAIIEDAEGDDRIALLIPEEAGLVFAPIFTLGSGNQQVVPVVPGQGQGGPGAPGGASQVPTPRPTRGPAAPTAQPPHASTPAPVPTRPAAATPRATATPRPRAVATPVPTPTPGHGPNPTRRPAR